MTCIDQIEPREVEWLWADRVPLGMITMFAGDPKLGKSLVTLAMAAAVSRGQALPQSDAPCAPGSTILMSAEDDATRTIVPRLMAAGADRSKIHVLHSVIQSDGNERLPNLRADIAAITAAAESLRDCRLIVIDPISAYLGGGDDNRNAMVRGVLSPLKILAERLQAAVVLVSHLTKGTSASDKYRVAGSIAYVGASRANFLFVADPTDPAGRRVLMLDNGGNVSPLASPLAYTIEDDGKPGPRLRWSDQPVALLVDNSARASGGTRTGDEAPALDRCDQWLKDALASGRVPAAELQRAGEAAGFSRSKIQRARSRVGAETLREGFGPGAKVYWQLRVAPGH
jgi:hypothetical protein